MNKIKMKALKKTYAVCRLEKEEQIPSWALKGEYLSITKTEDELSIVCAEECVPENIRCEKSWRILKVLGPLDFSLIGILSDISTTLANNNISIFAISTYDTDYILIKDTDFENGRRSLAEAGYEIESERNI